MKSKRSAPIPVTASGVTTSGDEVTVGKVISNDDIPLEAPAVPTPHAEVISDEMNSLEPVPLLADKVELRAATTKRITTVDDSDWWASKSDVGRARAENEDRERCLPNVKSFIVADGMGGHAAGEVASGIAIDVIGKALMADAFWGPSDCAEMSERLVAILKQANAEVVRQSEARSECRGMGSTAVVAVLHGHELFVANIGDSRAYLLRGETLKQLSQDHSIAAVLVEQKHITPEQARAHPMRNRLAGCLGIEDDILPDTNCVELRPDDQVLLCSDGLWDMLTDEEIKSHLQSQPTPEAAVEALIDAANEAGGKDNITAIVLHIRQEILPECRTLSGEKAAQTPKTLRLENSGFAPSDEDTIVRSL